jgi:hypothetical protein
MSNAAAFDEPAGMLMEGCEFGDPQLEAHSPAGRPT